MDEKPIQQHDTSEEDRERNIFEVLKNAPSREVETAPGAAAVEARAIQLHSLQMADHGWKIKARKGYGRWFLGMLVLQNLAVYILVFIAYFQGRLEDLPVVFTLIINGTLLETYFIIKIMVQWLFSDIDYKNKML